MANQNNVLTNEPEAALQKYRSLEITEVPERVKTLLEYYSKIPADDILPHILEVREAAWKISSLPSIGDFRFIDLALAQCPVYPEILNRLKSGDQQFLDVGCLLGQELRQLAFDGAKPENLYGTDIHSDFFQIGYDLFKDEQTLNSLFLPADVFAKESFLTQLQGKIDVIWAGNFLDQFNWYDQVKATKHILRLLAQHPETLFVGRLTGHKIPGEYTDDNSSQRKVYRHDVRSFKKMFHTATEDMGEKWETEVVAKPWESPFKRTTQDGALTVSFTARRLQRLDAATSHEFQF